MEQKHGMNMFMNKGVRIMTEQKIRRPKCKTCRGSGKVPKPPALGSGFSSGFTTFPDQYIPCYDCQQVQKKSGDFGDKNDLY